MVECDSFTKSVTINGGEMFLAVPEKEGVVGVGFEGVLKMLFDEMWAVDL